MKSAIKRPLSSVAEAKNYAIINLLSGKNKNLRQGKTSKIVKKSKKDV